MRIVDADVLSYGLLENHVAAPYVRPLIERGLTGEIEVFVTAATLLETYNTLYWYYRVRPRRSVSLKISLLAEGLRLVPESPLGFKIAVEENVPLGDALLVGTALENKIPVVVSNDSHVKKLCKKYGLIYENPIPKNVRSKMR